jgi:hypothetical protein
LSRDYFHGNYIKAGIKNKSPLFTIYYFFVYNKHSYAHEYDILWKVVENMPVIQFEEYKVKLNNILPTMDVVEKALNLDAAAKEIEELETASARPDFWNDVENSQKVQKRLKQLKDKTEKFASLRSKPGTT